MVEEYIPSTPFGYAFEDKPPTTGMRKEELLEQLATCMVAFMLDETTATISGIGPRPAADAIGGIHWDFVEGKAFLGKLVNKSILAFPTTRKLIEGSEPRLEKQVVEDKNRAHKANIIHRGGWRHLVNNSMLPPDDPTLPYNPGPYFDYISWGLSCLSRELLYHRSEYKNLRKILPPNVIPGFEGIKYKRFINLLDGHIRSQLEAYKTDPSYAVKYNHTAICHMDFHGNNVLISDADDQIVLIDWDLNGLLPIHNQYPEDRLTKLFVWERSQWEPQEIRKAVAANRKYTGMLKAKIERICQERGMSPRKIRQALGKGKSALGPYGDPFVEFVASSEMTTPERYFQYIYFDDRRWRKTLVQKGLGYFWMGVYRLEYELGAISEDWKPVLLVFAALLFAVWMLASYWPYMLLFAVVLLYIIIGRTTPVLFQVTPRNSEIDGSDNNRAVKLLMPLWTVILPILFQLILSSQPITIYPQPSLPLFRWPLDWFWLQSGLTSLTFLVCFALLCWTGILWWFLRMDWKIYSWGLRKWYHLFCNSSREDWGKAGALVLGGCLIWRAFTGAFPWGLITLISDIAAFWGVVSILWTILGYAWYRFFGMRIHNMTGRVLDDDVDEVGEK
ncbi:hypothetical protein BJ508DRAFT_133495 [Ascobolus immersus RN42]|uniref:Uncharacterized protein n=1 Tax=Ascobolus immersus RN42 TaxID=1160509 RepID=A0A3N4IJS5_ASCIM|nr:hypothetical protein BJ508DRAFT_133495 [Ascobolus immersus RN42]